MKTGNPRAGGGRTIRTLDDLAKMAGVSAGTVSRALAGKSVVNAKTREKIEALAREHNFRPNQMASKLRTQRTGVVGVVVPLGHDRTQHISDPFFMALLGYLADGLTEAGYDLMLSRVVPDDDDWLERIVDSGMLDGVLVIGQSNQVATIERVAAWCRPLVVWGHHADGQRQCVIGSDNRTGGRLAADHLIASGRRRLAFMGDIAPPEIAERYRGACEAAQAAGIGEIAVLKTHLAADGMEEDIAAHIERLDGSIDAIIAHSDLTAMATLRVLADHDVAVPERIAVVGFDDLPLATQTVPRLTTVRQDIRHGARLMIDALFARMGGEDDPSVVLPVELVVRDSA
ncbi:MAG: substrate-binding domain-containing protein [Sphingomonas sp.]|uniref:LacI family DNA-binding transcriptional regulator n=1 Tax=Sphingomonas sp. TaxID=28214 RepID=UPI001AC01C1C|nr:substrate-binding domain-containing protein [Sphingomonas sp.]MBN8806643.1 substrate-binding domain-containing protein [Sphingomonas sp.]